LVALAAALGVASLEAFWFQATTAEVYALNGLFTALLLYVALGAGRYGERTLLLLGAVGGLALSHHLSMVYVLAAALVVTIVGHRLVPRPKTVVLSIVFLLAGLSVWLYIPVRAQLEPPLTWGDTSSFRGFISHITARSYTWRLKPFDAGGRALDLLRFFKVLAGGCGAPLTGLASIGIALSLKRLRLLAGLLVLVGLFALHYAAYNIPDIESHMFPALLAVGVLAGVGLQSLSSWPGLGRNLRRAVIGFAFIVVAVNLAQVRPRADRWFALDYARAVEESAREACGDDCLIVTSGEPISFPLLYTSLAEAGGPRVFDMRISSPSVIGAGVRPSTIEECAALSGVPRGLAGVALLDAAPPYVGGEATRICGMIHVVGPDRAACKPPWEYQVRGAAEDLRDYSSRLLSASYYLHIARWCFQEKDGEGVRRYVERAIGAAPDDVGSHILAAKLYAEMGARQDALELARRAIGIDPHFFEARDMLAGLLLAGGDLTGAITEYRAALKGNPNPAPVESNLGNAYLARGDLAAAEASFTRAIALDSSLVNARIGLGRVYEGRGKLDSALRLYTEAIALDPSYDPACHASASLLLKRGSLDQARAVLEAGLGLRPSSALLLSDLGLVYLRSDRADSAVASLQRALAVDPSMLTARGNLAVAYEARGMKPEAIEQYRAYLDSAPPGPSRDRAEEALRRLQAAGLD
jgi:tetratricopeptide (TPR) repeat protein